jgi:putative ABC transport system permease protein
MKTSAQRLWNITLVGLKAILRNKMRSLLTMLGIVIGVGCVIVVVAIGNGATKSIQDTINSLGSNFIMIFPGTTTQGGARMFSGSSTLTIEDADAIKAEAPAVAYVSPNLRTSAQTVAGELNWGTSVYGVGVDWPFIRSWNVADGNFFTDSDVRSGSKVAVLGDTVAQNLFPQGGAVGQIVRIKNVPFKVIGVLDRKGGSTQGQDQDDQIIAPYTTVMKRLMGQNKLSMLYASAKSPEQVQDAQDQIDALLRQRHRIPPGGDADFMMRSQEEIASAQDAQMKILRTLLLSIAGISLLIGGIGIMNIMLVSVTERTREIGIRMAIGARGSDVLTQFLVESIVMGILGGVAGLALGIGGAKLVGHFTGWETVISPLIMLGAVGFSGAVGIFFGYYPARKAAALNPIEALRYE